MLHLSISTNLVCKLTQLLRRALSSSASWSATHDCWWLWFRARSLRGGFWTGAVCDCRSEPNEWLNADPLWSWVAAQCVLLSWSKVSRVRRWRVVSGECDALERWSVGLRLPRLELRCGATLRCPRR